MSWEVDRKVVLAMEAMPVAECAGLLLFFPFFFSKESPFSLHR